MKCIENMPKKNRDPKIFDKVKCVQNQLNSIMKVVNKNTITK